MEQQDFDGFMDELFTSTPEMLRAEELGDLCCEKLYWSLALPIMEEKGASDCDMGYYHQFDLYYVIFFNKDYSISKKFTGETINELRDILIEYRQE